MALSFAILGGDDRQRYAALYLRQLGHHVHTLGVPGLPDTENTLSDIPYIILPIGKLPVSPEILPADALIFWGKADAALLPHAQDYLTWESLAIANAVPTAEGAIQLAMERMPGTIFGSRFLVVGAGRIGMCLALKLHALGGHVTVTARKRRDIARIEALGLTADTTGQYHWGLSQYDCIMNTVPHPVFTKAQLASLQDGCVLMELASAPGGFPDGEHPVISGAALPGRVAPKAAGEILAKEILNFIRTL